MTPVQFIVGREGDESLEAALARMRGAPAWPAFDARAIAFVAHLSQRLLTSPAVRQYPEIAAMAHWFRAARLQELASAHPLQDGPGLVIGRGLAFHLAPANVDSVFMYSWLLSLLAGNVNVVRVSQKASPQVDLLVGALQASLADEAGPSVRGRLLLLTYAHDDAVTAAISQHAMVRVVWGGDATVAAIRAVPLRPTAVELAFPDRFSLTALASASVFGLAPPDLERLAAAFYNDTFWFGQQACSSPRAVAFVGTSQENTAARERFWPAVEQEVRRRQPPDDAAAAMARVIAGFEYAAAGWARPQPGSGPAQLPQRLLLEGPLSAATRDLHCGNGLFLEMELASLRELGAQLTDRDQTLAVHGFDRPALEAFVRELPQRALDRIVPVGQALAFDNVWDGQDLLAAFSRRVTLPA